MHDLNDIEFWKQRTPLDIDLLTLMSIHGNVCLALRHPDNIGESRELMILFVKFVGEHMVKLGVFTKAELKEIEQIERI